MLTDEEKLRIAIDLLRAMLSSTSPERVRRIDWWTRARSALETAASVADSYGSLVSKMGERLQIDALTPNTSAQVADLAPRVEADFEAFRAFLEREALYVVAIARAESKRRRAEWQADTQTEEH